MIEYMRNTDCESG